MAKPENVVVLNIASKTPMLKAEEIDTLVPTEAMEHLMNGDEKPFMKVEAIEYPIQGSGGWYTKEFFNSFIAVTKKRAIPGSKRGHEWLSRPHSDFYTIGGKTVDNVDGKTGIAYLKIYIPPKGDESENTGLIRDAGANIVNFSLVSAPEYKVKRDAESGMDVRYFTASKGYERNDAVEYGAGAMKQVVNSNGVAVPVEEIKKLIDEGHIDKIKNVEGNVIQNGIVYRSALRRLISRANEEDRTVLGELLSTIDKCKNGGKPVEKKELLEALKNMVTNGTTTLQEILENTGLKIVERNAEDEANAVLSNALKTKLGDKPLEALDAMIAENNANIVAVVENAVTALTPKLVKNTEGKEVVSDSFTYAVSKCEGKKGAELNAAVEALKTDKVMCALEKLRADGASGVYQSETGGNARSFGNSDDGIVTINVGGK